MQQPTTNLTKKDINMADLIFDDVYKWQGWGGKLKLGSGECRLRIFDLGRRGRNGLLPIKPIIVVASDIPSDVKNHKRMTVKGCASHIATCVVRDFDIDPHRMLWVEYYPAYSYGSENQNFMPAKFEIVEFTWNDGLGMHAKWRTPTDDMIEEILSLIDNPPNPTRESVTEPQIHTDEHRY